jgi:hypothetical protein
MSSNDKANALMEIKLKGEEPETTPVTHISLVDPTVFEVEEPLYKKRRLSPDSKTKAENITTEPRKKISISRKRRTLINQFVENNNKYIQAVSQI